MPSHPLPTFEIQKYCQKESVFKDTYSMHLPKIKDRGYLINLNE